MALKLTVTNTEDASLGRELSFDDEKRVILFGRGEESDVSLPGQKYGVSKSHARIERFGDDYYLFDHGSTNGTALNGKRVPDHISNAVSSGDKIAMGRWEIRCAVEAPKTSFARAPHGGDTLQVSNLPRSAPPLPEATAEDGPDPRVVELARQVQETMRAGQGQPADEQREQLAAVVGEAAGRVEPGHVLSVLQRLRRELKQPAEGDTTSPAALVAGVIDAETRDQWARRELAFAGLSRIAHELCNHERFGSTVEVERFVQLAHQALELTFEWVLNCISGRKVFEDKFGAKVTKFFGLDINPLKHALSPQQVGSYLLNPERERDPEKIKGHLADAFRDLAAHQLGLMAGVQSALKAAIEQLDPQKHEDKVAEQVGWAPWGRSTKIQARAWKDFKETYQSLLDNDSKLFNEVIYPNVRQGYLIAHGEQAGIGKDGQEGEGASASAAPQPR